MSTRVTDLTFLKNFTKGNQGAYEKYIYLFLTDSDVLMKSLQQKIDEEDWKGIESTSHTLRARFNFMGVKDAEEIMKVMRENAASQKNITEAKRKMKTVTLLFSMATKK